MRPECPVCSDRPIGASRKAWLWLGSRIICTGCGAELRLNRSDALLKAMLPTLIALGILAAAGAPLWLLLPAGVVLQMVLVSRFVRFAFAGVGKNAQ